MNILGFNPSHHSSVCLLQDGEIKYFIQEERLNRKKYDSIPFKSFIDLIQNYKIDYITWATPGIPYPINPISNLPYWVKLAQSYNPQIKFVDYSHSHHLSHCASSFFNSEFKECVSIIIDGLGSPQYNNKKYIGHETESIFYCSYPNNFQNIYKNIIDPTQKINLSRAYEAITMHLGWSRDNAGKTMGLSSYGKLNKNFPNFFNINISNSDVFYFKENTPQEVFVNSTQNPYLKLQLNPKEWHYNKSKITNLEKDLAWKIQNDTQQIVGDYIEKAIKETGLKQVCCAGGYFLNCVANYYLTKRFPDIEFYFEPIANDAGTAIGAAKLLWHESSQSTAKKSQKSLYYGPQYSKEQLLKGIEKYVSN